MDEILKFMEKTHNQSSEFEASIKKALYNIRMHRMAKMYKSMDGPNPRHSPRKSLRERK